MKHLKYLLIVGLVPMLASPSSAPAAQEQADQRDSNSTRRRKINLETRVFQVQKLSIDEAHDAVAQLFGSHNVAALEQANSLVVRDTTATLDQIGKLLSMMEEQAGSSEERVTSDVVPLTNREPADIVYLLNELFHRTNIMPDDYSKQIILKGNDPAEIEEILRMIKALDVEEDHYAQRELTKTLSVTIDFVRAKIGAQGSGNLPPNLQGVGAALLENGLGDASVFGHLMVRSQEEQEFESNGVVRSDDAVRPPSFLRAQGAAELVDGHAQLRIKASVNMPIAQSKTDNAGQAKVRYSYEDFGLSTTTTVPLGDYLVLGAMPASMEESDTILMVIRVTTD